jgi:Polyketide cyclase / dehydrase and lipid transport
VTSVRTSRDYPGRIADAEALWYDLGRWAAFIDGFHHIDKREGDWPHADAVVIWQSFPGGRGRVLERVTSYTPREGQTLEVEDEKLLGTRRVKFAALQDGVRIELSLDYELKERNALTRLTDVFFIRRAMRDSLRRELARFGSELQTERELR